MADESKDLTELEAAADGSSDAVSASDESSSGDAPIEAGSSVEDQASAEGQDAPVADESPEEEAVAEEQVTEEVEEPAGELTAEEQLHVPEPVAPVLSAEEEAAALAAQMDWYILKVQSNRENSIVDALLRRVKVEGLEAYFGEVIVPVEKVTEFKGGKKKVVKKKLYPGYIVAQMVVTEDTWFLVRETPGVGDFTGAGGKPTPMDPKDVERIRPKVEEGPSDEPRLKIDFKPDDKVKINDGTFENFEGEVSGIDEASGRVTVMINIFGRSTPVELEHWQVEKL